MTSPQPIPHRAKLFPTDRFASRRLWFGSLACLAVVVFLWLLRGRLQTTAEVDSIKLSMSQRRYGDVERSARKWLKSHSDDTEVALLFGEALQRQGHLSESLEVYQRIPENAGKTGVAARLASASILLSRGRLNDAEQTLLSVTNPSTINRHADGLWVTLYSLSGRRWESMPALRRTVPTASDRLMKLILWFIGRMCAEDVFH